MQVLSFHAGGWLSKNKFHDSGEVDTESINTFLMDMNGSQVERDANAINSVNPYEQKYPVDQQWKIADLLSMQEDCSIHKDI
jgi:hypothetical protein